MKRTKEQMKAIMLHGCNLLVAAAAGSGKTSVLIERIFKMVSAPQPVDIDRLLVVTFTNAAAAEMRERMEKSLEEAFEADPDNKNLQKQLTLLHKSHIMTIDSFCAEVLRNHFEEVDLDPSFRIADNTELKLLQEDVLSDVLEECYQKAGQFPGFLQFMDSYAPGRSDKAAEAVILAVYHAATAYPDPKGWLLEKRKEVEKIPDTPLEEQAWMKKLLFYFRTELKSYQKEIERLIGLCEYEEGLEPYQITLQSDLELLQALFSAEHYSDYAEIFYRLSFAKLGRIKKAEKEALDPDLVKEIKDGRDTVKAAVLAMKENYFPKLPKAKEGEKEALGKAVCAELMEDLQGTVAPLLAMYDIVLAFMEAYMEAKRERNILDFSDQEHLALQILTAPDGSPSSVALELREYFEEILIDEYQDSNRLQEVILSAISRGRNMFLVGDVKQSIYKFRLARPELFMEKYHAYPSCNIEDAFAAPEAESHKIDLSKNFRSREVVLDTVNYLFSRIMGKQLGNIEYDRAAALYAGRGDASPVNEQEESELLLITPESEKLSVSSEAKGVVSKRKKEKEQGKIELEAAHIAGRIKKLVLEQKFPVACSDGTGEGTRQITYGDIAILLRTMNGWSEVFLKVLQEAGIPAVTATGKGYFEASEVKVLLNLLKLIGNERQDIPLAAVMLSRIGAFTEEELALIRSREADKEAENMLYDICQNCMDGEWEETALQQKLILFFQQIDHFRNLAACLPVPELIEQILIMTGYDDCVLAMPDGEKRYGNVRMLIQKAEDFEKTSYHGLFQFNRYMERLKKYEIDFGEADIAGSMDAVQIMSIHKSKGLEFPVVFVSGLGKQFNLMDTRKNIVIHQELFAGADFVDLKKRIQVPTVVKKVLQHDMVMETLGEELRVLYVAMTRAKEKLILTGYVEKPEDAIRKWLSQGSVGKLPIHVLGNAKTFLDFVMPVFLQKQPPEENENNRTGFDFCRIKVQESNYDTLLLQAAVSEHTREWKRQELLHYQGREGSYGDFGTDTDTHTGMDGDHGFYHEILSQMETGYPYETAIGLKTKFTVSELKRAYAEEWELEEDTVNGNDWKEEEEMFSWNPEYVMITVPDTDRLLFMDSVNKEEPREKLVPSFIKPKEGQETGGVMIGTLYHEVMRRLDFLHADTTQRILIQLEEMKKKGILTDDSIKKIRVEKLKQFLACPIGKRIAYAQKEGKLFREQPFVMGMDSSVFLKKGIEQKETEMVLVQGVIDLFFEEDGKLILLDYKTDRVKQAQELKERYGKQLKYYGEALERTRNLPVEEKYLYSFHLGELIACEGCR